MPDQTGQGKEVEACQWSMGVGAQQTLAQTPSGSVLLTTSSGQAVFTSNGKGGYIPPAGDANLSLSEHVTRGGVVTFRHATNGSRRFRRIPFRQFAGGPSGPSAPFAR